MTGADFDDPGFTTEESLLRERAINVVARTGGMPIDLFIMLINAGIDPEEVQSEGAHRIWRGPYSLEPPLDHESRYEDVPEDHNDPLHYMHED